MALITTASLGSAQVCLAILSMKVKDKTFNYTVPYLCIPPTMALSLQTGSRFIQGGSRPSPGTRTLTCAALQL